MYSHGLSKIKLCVLMVYLHMLIYGIIMNSNGTLTLHSRILMVRVQWNQVVS